MVLEEACKCINGANAYMISPITVKTKIESSGNDKATTFNILAWMRARRLSRVGHILRLKLYKSKDKQEKRVQINKKKC